jgi:hypothetical protein
MAKPSYKNGRQVWLPDRVDVPKGVLLLPELSPMENLWRLIIMTASVWLNWAKLYAEHKEDMEELEQQTRLVIFVEFRRRVLKGEYNHSYNLWQNLRSVAWSKFSHAIVEPWLERIRIRRQEMDGNEVISDRDHGGSTLFSLIADGSTPRFTTDSDSKKTREIDSYKSYWNKHKAYVLLVDDEYMRYVEFCDENTVKPMEFRSWFESNYSEGDIRLYDGTDDPANDVSKPKSATREYWQQYNAKRRERQRLYQQQRKGTR